MHDPIEGQQHGFHAGGQQGAAGPFGVKAIAGGENAGSCPLRAGQRSGLKAHARAVEIGHADDVSHGAGR